MKIFILVLLLLLSSNYIKAQTCKDVSLGTKTVYPAPPVLPGASSPAGYEAVFINHAGRHGARHMTKDLGESDTYCLLKQADSLHTLSADGQKLWQMVQQLAAIERKEIKNISYLGRQEQQGIGKRMAESYPTVFHTEHTSLNITVTKEVRTVQSADAFLTGLQEKITGPVMRRQVNDTTLRFYDLSPAYAQFEKSGPWKTTLQQLETANSFPQLSQGAASRFFTPSFVRKLEPAVRQSFATDIVGYANILYSLPGEIKESGIREADLRFAQFFNCTELQTFSRMDNAEEFLVKGPGTDPAGIQVKIAVPLLIDFIRSTDRYISTQSYNAELRFTHAEAIAPFAALIGIQGASTATKTATGIARVWNAARIIPLSANIQWILYKKKGADDYLVKFLLNEREARIEGLAPGRFPYYSWSAVRKFYLDKLERLGASLDTDGLTYLREMDHD